jgi:hypothetical protein
LTTESVENQKTVGNSVDSAAHEAASSPTNNLTEPTQAQKEAGNYAKGHVRIAGLDISIENPEGSTRSGSDKGGKPWSIKMRSHYGYILGTIGKDKDHIDVFVKPGTAEDYAGPVFIIDQKNAAGGFDEHKVMLGWGSQDAAVLAYKANYTPGWDGIRAVTPMSMEQFKGWLENGNHQEPAEKPSKTPLQSDIAKLKPNVELKQGDLIGASQEESDAIASKIEEKRRQLVEIEDRIVGAAGLAPGFIEDAMRSRKVPSSMKEQREAIRAELADMRKQHAAVTAADRLLASKGGLDEANAESKQTGAADSSDELDSAKIRAGYSHRSLGRLSDKVKMEQGWFVNAANEFAEKVGKDAESDEQKELADKLLAEFKAEYKTRRYRVMAVGETVVSSAVAGRNNFNSAQAGKRGSALDRAEQQFSDWQNDAIENGVRAVTCGTWLGI